MNAVEEIRGAEAHVADLQKTLDAVQSGLETAEVVATAVEEHRRWVAATVKVAVGLLALSVLAAWFSRRRKSSGEEPDTSA